MSLARNSLDKWKRAIDNGGTKPLSDMLADNFIFERSQGEQEDKTTVLSWVGEGGFTIGDWVVYHEDDNIICGTHSMTPEEGPTLSVMYFAKFEANKCVFWKVHSHLPE
ncbi:MAG: hypothetical protein GY881_13270 [Gammaproteobacteria bacterium]|nr:hypothetical protein [Gammaproteobacteria bacterium]